MRNFLLSWLYDSHFVFVSNSEGSIKKKRIFKRTKSQNAMKTTELTTQIQCFLDVNEPIVLQVYAIIGNKSELIPLFLTRDETTHLSYLYSKELSKLITKKEHHLDAADGSISDLFFHGQGFMKVDIPLSNSQLPTVSYLLIELKKDNQKVQLLKKITHKQVIEGRQQHLITATPKISARNVLDLTPKVKAVSINNHTFIA